jgi:hypothetical protein
LRLPFYCFLTSSSEESLPHPPLPSSFPLLPPSQKYIEYSTVRFPFRKLLAEIFEVDEKDLEKLHTLTDTKEGKALDLRMRQGKVKSARNPWNKKYRIFKYIAVIIIF